MSVKHKAFSLVFDAETTRPGEQTFAEPDPPPFPRFEARTNHAWNGYHEVWFVVDFGAAGAPYNGLRVADDLTERAARHLAAKRNAAAMSDTTDPIGEAFARRLRDVERAGKLRNLLTSAEFGALESARYHLYTTRDLAAAGRHLAAARFYRTLYSKVCRMQARARGEIGS